MASPLHLASLSTALAQSQSELVAGTLPLTPFAARCLKVIARSSHSSLISEQARQRDWTKRDKTFDDDVWCDSQRTHALNAPLELLFSCVTAQCA